MKYLIIVFAFAATASHALVPPPSPFNPVYKCPPGSTYPTLSGPYRSCNGPRN